MPTRVELLLIVLGVGLALTTLLRIAGEYSPEEPRPVDAVVAPVTTETVVVTSPPPSVDELPASIGRVLAEGGHTEFVAVADLQAELPASIVAVLVDHDATLAVAGDGAP